WADLRAKQRFANYMVTQLCFDARTVCRFVTAARARGINLPVTVGVPGAVDMARLLRVSLRIGIGDSVRFLRGNRTTVRKLLRLRGYRPDALVRQLGVHVQQGDCDLSGLHIYTFNHVAASVRWADQLRRRLDVAAVPK
ncbi:MAG: methylenetetrahydrofolate reductase, partial [Stackebrandtia sp.]